MSTPTLPRHTAFATPRSWAYAASSNVLPARHAAPVTGARGPQRRALRVQVVVVTLLVALVVLVVLVVVHVLQANVSGSAEMVKAATSCAGGRTTCALTLPYTARPTA